MNTNPKAVLTAAVLLFTGVLYPGPPCHAMDQLDAPETVTIDTLANLYQPVAFSHKRHVLLARCKDCHHHTTGQQDMDENCVRCHADSPESTQVACSDCHTPKPFYPEHVTAMNNPNLYHIDKPGLKGAYHLNCVGCHERKDGPTGCEGCHAMTDKGKAFFDVHDTNAAGKTKESHPR